MCYDSCEEGFPCDYWRNYWLDQLCYAWQGRQQEGLGVTLRAQWRSYIRLCLANVRDIDNGYVPGVQ